MDQNEKAQHEIALNLGLYVFRRYQKPHDL